MIIVKLVWNSAAVAAKEEEEECDQRKTKNEQKKMVKECSRLMEWTHSVEWQICKFATHMLEIYCLIGETVRTMAGQQKQQLNKVQSIIWA